MAVLAVIRRALWIVVLTLPAAAVELRIQFSAIQKVLAQQIFPASGRFYVKGDPGAKCNFAYLENPLVEGGEGHLRVRARFSGRNGRSLFGLCLGLGDEFDLSIRATPYFEKGLMRLRDVQVDAGGRETFYSNRVRDAIQKQMPEKFQFRVEDEAKRILESRRTNEPYQQQLTRFEVASIRVTPQALILNLDFTLVVR